jgi:hypothetical protein
MRSVLIDFTVRYFAPMDIKKPVIKLITGFFIQAAFQGTRPQPYQQTEFLFSSKHL